MFPSKTKFVFISYMQLNGEHVPLKNQDCFHFIHAAEPRACYLNNQLREHVPLKNQVRFPFIHATEPRACSPQEQKSSSFHTRNCAESMLPSKTKFESTFPSKTKFESTFPSKTKFLFISHKQLSRELAPLKNQIPEHVPLKYQVRFKFVHAEPRACSPQKPSSFSFHTCS